jgi:hypothetical protein
MPDHVHVVAARQEMHAEDIAGHLKRAGSRQLRKVGLHPFDTRRAVAPVNPGGHAGDAADHAGSSVGHARTQSPPRLPTPWGEHGWKVFLFDLDEVEQAIEYVNANPIEAGHAPQHWPWVKPYEG